GGRVRRTHRLAVLHHPRPVLEYEHWRPRLTQIIAWDGEAVRILRNHYARRIVSRLDEYERRDSVFLPVHERRGDDQNAVHGPVVRPQRAIRRPPRTPREPRLDNLKAERREQDDDGEHGEQKPLLPIGDHADGQEEGERRDAE